MANDGTVKIGVEFEVDDSQLKEVTQDVQESVDKPKKTIEEFAQETGQTVEQVKAKIRQLAEEYQAAGMTVQNAFKRAYADLGVMSDAAAKKQRKALQEVEQAADGAADGISDVAERVDKTTNAINKADESADDFSKAAKNLSQAAEGAGNSLDSLKDEAENTDRNLDSAESAIDDMADAAKDAKKHVDDAADAVDDLGDKARQSSNKMQGVEENTEDAAKETKEYGEQARKATLNTDKLLSSLTKLSAVAGGAFKSSIGIAGSTLKTLSTVAGTTLATAAKATTYSMGAVAAGLGSVIAYGSTYNSEMEQLQTSFEVMTGSAEKAADIIERLRKMGAETPFETKDLAEVTQLLINYGISADNAIDAMSMLGDVSQGNAEKMKGIATAYGQMSSAGKVYLQDIKQMIERGFNPLQEISETTGESMDSLYDRISKSTLSVDEITRSIERSTSKGGKYFQSMEKQSQTMAGQISTLNDNFSMLAGTIAGDTTSAITQDFLPALNEMLSSFDDAFITGGFEGLAETFGESLGDIISEGLVKLPEFMDLGTSLMQSIYSGFMQNSSSVRSGLIQVIEELPAFISDNMGLMFTAGGVLASALFNGIIQNSDEIASGAMDVIQSMIGFFAAHAPEFAEAATSLIESFATEMESDGEQMLEAIGGILSLIPKFISDNFGTLLKGGTGLTTAIIGMFSSSIQSASSILSNNSGDIADSAVIIIESLADFLVENTETLTDTVVTLITALANKFSESGTLEKLMQAGVDIAFTLINAIAANSGGITNAAISIVTTLFNTIVKPENFAMISGAASTLLSGLISGFGDNYPALMGAIDNVITTIVNLFEDEDFRSQMESAANKIITAYFEHCITPENMKKGIETAAKLVSSIIDALFIDQEDTQNIIDFVAMLFAEIGMALADVDWIGLGKAVIGGIWSGITGEEYDTAGAIKEALGDVSGSASVSSKSAKTNILQVDTQRTVETARAADELLQSRLSGIWGSTVNNSTSNRQNTMNFYNDITISGSGYPEKDADQFAIEIERQLERNAFGGGY